jgi:carbon-monoxide dehydrogenase medium subunit
MIRDFEYSSPQTLEEALTLISKYQHECKVIAGGQSLLILMRQGLLSPEYLVDIKGLTELSYIQAEADGGLRIGALTTHRLIEKSPLMKNNFRVLAEMERRLASIQTRNWGTIGGNLCHADPAGDPTSVLMALNATLTTASLKGKRDMAVEDFCKDYFETALQPEELLLEIQVPPAPPHTGTAYTKFNIIESDMATVAVAASVTLASGKDVCDDARIVLGACASTQMRAKRAEEVLRGKRITDRLLEEAGLVASEEAEPISDVTASEEYRRELVKVLVPRMGQQALARARKA